MPFPNFTDVEIHTNRTFSLLSYHLYQPFRVTRPMILCLSFFNLDLRRFYQATGNYLVNKELKSCNSGVSLLVFIKATFVCLG